ncbi:adenylate/guanylate cyclase domain-containing protein [Rhodococcus sp. 14-2483-1-2]|uniref:adenylate/guanylate cyclase domain-containing protein n=1 Tax=Rhodococcus sp. 14-2483-1-2 TaxID=2023147 RepID=UPI000B9BA4AB|nr:adenylate/guanylate cyclase domain-containing protein [Rhodococcus sp. 14-2483-1-2]OZF26014.1 hypothetical protein CH295_25560 [Rhodococcus sp. 14-2483-1-2]
MLEEVSSQANGVLNKRPSVMRARPGELDADALPDAAEETWYRLDDVVAIFADLKNSTQLNLGKNTEDMAAIYSAASGSVTQIMDGFDVDYVQVQGDGVLGIFWGPKRYARALCSGMMVKSFSENTLVPRLTKRWANAANTGYKVGLSSGHVLVKNVGTPEERSQQQPVWAGNPVNYAAKASQQAKPGELIVTDSVWRVIKTMPNLMQNCTHSTRGSHGSQVNSTDAWQKVIIDKIAHDASQSSGQVYSKSRCNLCGSERIESSTF